MSPRSPSRPPAASPRLKRRILSGAVDDNLRALRNQPRGRLHRRRPVSWALVAAATASAVAGAALWLVLELPESAVPPLARVPPRAASDAVLVSGTAVRTPAQVFPVAVRKVVVDPGHGGGDLGTRAPLGLVEKELTLDIARRLVAQLRADGFEVELTRDGDRRISLRDRALAANELGADLFVSIHVNWLEDGRANRGIETYFLGPSDDPFIVRLTSAENRESGYAIADVRRLLDSIYADLRQEQSRALARAVQRQLVRSLREVTPEVADRGVKSAPFLVLVATEMPAILAEVASLSNADEARLLAQEGYRERIAVALYRGIRSYSESVAQTATPTEAR